MINYENEQIARRNDPLAKWIGVTLFLVSLGLVITSVNVKEFRAVFQSTALILLTAAVFLVSKYVLCTFVYRTEQRDNGDYDFVVTEVKANRRVVLVRLSFGRQITGFTENADEIRQIKKQKKIPCYRYCTEMLPKQSFLLYAKDGDEQIAVILQPNPSMRETLLELIAATNREEK